ncbi:carboxypeptidase-like regulatory domain-containing protein [Thermococcus sp.]
MDRVRVSLLVFLLSVLMVLSLSYALIPQGGLAKGILKLREDSSGEKTINTTQSYVLREGNFPPKTNFTFKPTNRTAPCPVSLYPYNPQLVCVDTPARGIPIPTNETWDMVVRQPGVYYVPVEVYGLIKGVAKFEYLKIDKPLQKAPIGGTFSVNITSIAAGSLVFKKSKYLEIVNSTELPMEFRYTIHVSNDAPPGYYPLFFDLNVSGYIESALLAWVRVLPRAVVKITSMPSTLRGNGKLIMQVAGTVTYPSGDPVRGGTITITLNRSKTEEGIVVGVSDVVNGTFNVTCEIPPEVPAGSYSVVAHYTGPDAYPGNSDPEVFIRRYPEIDANITDDNGTVITGFLHYKNVPLNGSVTLIVETGNGLLRIPLEVHNGIFNVTINSTVKSVKVLYPGNGLYLPVEKTVYRKSAQAVFGIEFHTSSRKVILYSISTLIAIGIAGIVVKRARIEVVNEKPVQEALEFLNVPTLSIKRRVFLEGETIELSNVGCEVRLDGKPVNKGRIELNGVGIHVLEVCNKTLELWVLPPKDAVVMLYKLHFLPFVSKYVPVNNKTPYEIALALSERGFPEEVFQIAWIFIDALYSLKDIDRRDFFRMVNYLQLVGVFE